ncbi:MAG: ThuA domain-containing protein [Akkermansiaceae bacterium]
MKQSPRHPLTQALGLCALLFAMSTIGNAHPVPESPKWLTYDGKEGSGKGKHIVLIAADQEYRSEQAIPMLAKILSTHHGFDCTVLFAVNEKGEVDPTMPVYPKKGKEKEFKTHSIPGTGHLAKADLVIFFHRLLTLPEDQLKNIVSYLDSGKPMIALRTANHGFRGRLPYEIDGKNVNFGRDLLGGAFMGHHGGWKREGTRGIIEPKNKDHAILKGVTDIFGFSDVYRTYKEGTSLPEDCTNLVWGQPLVGLNKDDKPNTKKEPLPVAWIKNWKTTTGKQARVFNTTMGSAKDLESEGLRRLVINASLWCVGLEDAITPDLNVDIIGEYKPRKSGFNYEKLGVTPQLPAYFK